MSDELNKNSGSSEKSKESKTEVRYVPIEYMHNMHEDEDELDLVELSKTIWNGRWLIVKIIGVFIVIGLFIAIFSHVEYESEAILMPEVQQQEQGRAGQLLQQFGGAFGMGGIDLSQAQPGSISPMIYPRIVNSLSFQMELMEQEIRFADYGVSTTIPDFYENFYSPSLTEYILKYTIELPYTIIGWLSPGENIEKIEEDPIQSEFIWLSQEELKLVENIRKRITINMDDETGLITSRVILHDARAAAELNRFVIELLKEYVTEYRLEKARQDLEFVEEQHAQARERFERDQIQLAEFRDQNISLSTARAQTELERLQDQKDLAFNVYNSLSQQLEQAKLKLQEQTPVFNTVQSVNIPSDKSSPKRGLIIILSIFFGFLAGVGVIFAKIFYMNYSNYFKKK